MSLIGTQRIVQLEGELDLHVAPEIAATLNPIIAESPVRLVIDLSRVTYIDSSGLAVLIRAVQDVETYGGRLMIAGAKENVRSIIESAGLSSFFLTFPHVDAALAAI